MGIPYHKKNTPPRLADCDMFGTFYVGVWDHIGGSFRVSRLHRTLTAVGARIFVNVGAASIWRVAFAALTVEWGGMECQLLLLGHLPWGYWCIWFGVGSSGMKAFAPHRFTGEGWYFHWIIWRVVWAL